MSEQRRALGTLLSQSTLDAIGRYVADQIREAHPGCKVDRGLNAPLALLRVEYHAPAPCTDLCFVIDSSGSLDPVAFAAMGDGAREIFRAHLGDGQRRDYSVVNFSSQTLSSGWVPKTKHARLDELLSLHQGQGSELDPSVVQQLLNERKRSAIVMVTDGDLQNGNKIIPYLCAMTKQGHKMGVVYVGRPLVPVPLDIEQMGKFADVQHTFYPDMIKKAMLLSAKNALSPE